MDFCRRCQHITFNPVNKDSLDSFEAIIQPDFASLERSAKARDCKLCVALHGMIQHRSLGFPGTAPRILDERLDIALGIHYQEERSDEWFWVNDEIGGDDIDAPPLYLVARHAFYSECFRIYNRESISRSSLRFPEQETPVLAVDIEDASAASERVASDTSTGSDASFALMRSWIDRCEQNHTICGKKPFESDSKYPARLLDVSSVEGDSGVVFLVSSIEVNQQRKRPPYATLSHRWKPDQTFITNEATEHKHTIDGIPTKSLSRTFREAAITTKKLGLRYLWIDSICILQDVIEDKEREIPKMADYYQNAALNISAATEQNDGLWQERDGHATRPFNIPITINTPNLPNKTHKIVLRVAPVLEGVTSHLDSRGWLLQERIFPRRTLFFDPYWISFECAEMSASESCPEGIRNHHDTNSTKLQIAMGTDVNRDPTLSTMGGLLRDLGNQVANGKLLDEKAQKAAMGLWFRSLKDYSGRHLSFHSDRFNAISALAERLSHILQDEYIGGLWKSRLILCLQWTHDVVYTNYRSATREIACGAPTWSWASVGRKNEGWMGIIVESSSLEENIPLVQVLDINWNISGSNKFGDMSDGRITLSGRPLRGYAYCQTGGPDVLRDLITMKEELEELPRTKITLHPEYGTDAWKKQAAAYKECWWLHICGEKMGERARIIIRIFPDTSECLVEGFCYLLPIAHHPGVGESGQQEGIFGLILKEVVDGVFERVGCARVTAAYLMTAKERPIVLI